MNKDIKASDKIQKLLKNISKRNNILQYRIISNQILNLTLKVQD